MAAAPGTTPAAFAQVNRGSAASGGAWAVSFVGVIGSQEAVAGGISPLGKRLHRGRLFGQKYRS